MRLLGILAIAAAGWAAPAPPVVQELGVRIPMRDGVRLAANVFRPAAADRLPAILVRTPYGKPKDLTPYYRGFVDAGYALVLQDVRGRYESEGAFGSPQQEIADADDTLNWIARQPWSNERVAMMGGSYLGIAQWKAALSGNRHLKAIFPAVAGCDEYFDRFYSQGGALKLGQRLLWISENLRPRGTPRPDFSKYIWTVPLRSADRAATGSSIGLFQFALNHPTYDAQWRVQSTCEAIEHVTVPTHIAGGWYDNFVEGDLRAFSMLRSHGRSVRAIIGPWAHNMAYNFPGFSFGPEEKLPLRRYQLQWFDHYAREGQGGVLPGVPLRIFVMGINEWREEHEWPLRRARPRAFYLSSGGSANTLGGDGRLVAAPPHAAPPDTFLYDPKKPVPTTGGAICCNPKILPPGPLDQRPVERRRDVLVYTSEPMAQPLEVTGPVRAILYVSTSAPDTDFTVKLVDVHPDGYARILTDGILRLRYRDSVETPALAKPGQVYRIVVEAGVTSNVFLRGHRIRIGVSSSNFPRFDRNPNTGRPVADEKDYLRATQQVWHDAERPSHIVLPVVRDARDVRGQAAASLR